MKHLLAVAVVLAFFNCSENSTGTVGTSDGANSSEAMSSGEESSSTQLSSSVDVSSSSELPSSSSTLGSSSSMVVAPLLNLYDGGYVRSGNMHGYAWTAAVGSGTTIDPADFKAINRGDTKLCASGKVGKDPAYGGHALIGINLNQESLPPAGAMEPAILNFLPTGTGIRYKVNDNIGGTDLRIQIQDFTGTASGRWCAFISGKSTGVVLWSDFNTTCWSPATGQPYKGQPIKDVAFDVPGKDTQDAPYNFCVEQVEEADAIIDDDPGELTVGQWGYVTSGDWKGYATIEGVTSTAQGASPTTMYSSGFGIYEKELCASGVVGKSNDQGAIAALRIKLNQVQRAAYSDAMPAAGTYTPTGTGINYRIANYGQSKVYMEISDNSGAAIGRWCADVTNQPSGTIPWSTFNTTCWSPTNGTAYNEQALQELKVYVPGSITEDVPYHFCIKQIEEAN